MRARPSPRCTPAQARSVLVWHYLDERLGSREVLSSRVRFGYYLGDRSPVEALEALIPLQVLQVAANSALPQKLLELLSRNVLLLEQFLKPAPLHRPHFSDGERLFQETKVRERRHEANALPLQVLSESLEIEPGLKVMHPGLEYALSVQSYPQADCAERLLPFAEARVRKVDLCFIRLKVHVCEYDDIAGLVLEYLRPPACPFASV